MGSPTSASRTRSFFGTGHLRALWSTRCACGSCWIAERTRGIAVQPWDRLSSYGTTRRLAVFYDDVLQDVRHVLARVDGGFEEVINFFQLDEGDGVLFFVEEVR